MCRPQGNGQRVMSLVEELNLQSSTLISSPSAKNRYIWYNGQLNVRIIIIHVLYLYVYLYIYVYMYMIDGDI